MKLRRKPGTYALMLAAVLSVLAGTTPQAVASSASTEVRVMTWNVHGEDADIPGVASVIRTHGVDVVTVQEIHRRPDWDQVRELADALGWHISTNVHFGRSDNPGPCDDEWPGDAGNAVLSAFPIVEKVTKPLSPANQDCPVKRSMAGVKIDVNGTALLVFTSHFTPGHGTAAVTLRQQQARTVVDYLTHPGPLLFTGDLNDVATSTIHGWFVDAGFLDTGARFADDPTLGTARIDYIFSRAMTVTGGFVPDPGYSDHRPVIMDVVL